MKTTCPICGSREIETQLILKNIPYFQCVSYESETLAKQVDCGTLDVTLCKNCGFVFNRAFDPRNVIYGDGYHVERGNSKYYREHEENVADFIDSTKPIKGKHVLEVGCGTGEFLKVVSKRGPGSCIGVDPSAGEGGNIHNVIFDESYLKNHPHPIDILINRHMIEHMENPIKMLQLFAQALSEDGVLYLETPRLDWILENHVFYDFAYEHCSYYTDDFMSRLLESAGFSIIEMKMGYDGQYFSILARKDGAYSQIAPADPNTLKQLKQDFCKTEEIYLSAKEKFSSPNVICTGDSDSSLQNAYLWGASAKGVMCCNLLGGSHISGCIDKNIFKQGNFIPGTGYIILSPSDISYDKVKCVLVVNDIYFDEIEEDAHNIDARIKVFSLNELLGIGRSFKRNNMKAEEQPWCGGGGAGRTC